MFRRLIGILAAASLMALTASAGTDPDPKAIIRQAITAMGGIENLRQIRAVHKKVTWRLHSEGESILFEGEIWQQLPDRLKQSWQANISGIKQSVGCIVRGNDAWNVINGVPQNTEGSERAELCATVYEKYVTALWPLLEDQSFTLTAVPVKTVNGRAAQGVRVAKPKQPDVTLFFDRESHLLVLWQRPLLNDDEHNTKIIEVIRSDYRTIDFRIDDEKRLHQAGMDTRDASLLAFLKRQVLSEAGRARCQQLIDQLGDPAYAVRRNARQELAKFGLCAVPLLRSAAKNQDLEVSAAANDLLEKANAESTITGPIPAALRLLTERRTPGAIEVILAYLPGASNDLLARAAQKALADLSTNQGKPDPTFEKALANAEPVVRATARLALDAATRPPATNIDRQLFLKGIKFPFRSAAYDNGKISQESEVIDVEFYSQLADSIFASPP
jgi:hypothetical protein